MIYQKLLNIQVELKAPKNLFNKFGNYNYRNAEGILEAVKPFLKKENVSLIVQDEIVQVGERYYIKATATLVEVDTAESVNVSAFARESFDKKGMDDSQITGTASSYARKYALNGLFLLDDTKDADTNEYHEQTTNRKPNGITEEQNKMLLAEIKRTGVSLSSLLKSYGVNATQNLTADMYNDAMGKLKSYPTKGANNE